MQALYISLGIIAARNAALVRNDDDEPAAIVAVANGLDGILCPAKILDTIEVWTSTFSVPSRSKNTALFAIDEVTALIEEFAILRNRILHLVEATIIAGIQKLGWI